MGYYDQITQELKSLIASFEEAKRNFDEQFAELQRQNEIVINNESIVKQLARERQNGFPTLAKAYDDFFKLQDKNLIDFLTQKDKPAISASEVVVEYGKLRRKAEKENKILRYIIDNYESLFPSLVDLREETEDIKEDDRELMSEYTEEELQDEVTHYITKVEYRKLSTVEKNQLALDRYWKRPKSKRHIGKIYERYVGYLYEQQGYEVDYVGISKGLEDLGRDIIAKKGKELIVIQCKNWSKFKTIYEKHIFQFFGTVFQYKDENKNKGVKAIFYSTTKLSDLARRFANELDIKLVENDKIPTNYPCIKCNISRVDGTKIYHLPFDQHYDKVKVETGKGEFYCVTVKEAEGEGYRRAFRYKGFQSQ